MEHPRKGCHRKVKLLVSNCFWGRRRFKKVTFSASSSWNQLHKIKHDGKMDLRIQKRKLSVYGRKIYLQNAEKRGKILDTFVHLF